VPSRIEDYALIGNLRTSALVGRDGSIDWLCAPRFDDAACFSALLGTPEQGRWIIAPAHETRRISRRYRDDSLVLETTFTTSTGTVRVTDLMPIWGERTDVVRIVEGVRGKVKMRMELALRFGYGEVIPWVHRVDDALLATGGACSAEIRSLLDTHGKDYSTVADFTVSRGERLPFVVTFFPSHAPRPVPIDPFAAEAATLRWWQKWCAKCRYDGRWGEAVKRSLITLKSLTYIPTGGMVAAPTTSLPETAGGSRNWDYRFCWVRDSTFTLYALLSAGYREEASAWRDWLLRSAAGRPEDLQTLYAVDGDRVRTEFQLPWLDGYLGSKPVRVGNAASVQVQLDVYGELIDSLCLARRAGLQRSGEDWRFERALLTFLEKAWSEPDHGIWETRGEKRHFTHSKVMAWAAFDRAVADMKTFDLPGPAVRWARVRDRIHADVCEKGFDRKRNTFVQYYGGTEVDASLLLLVQVGFLSPNDPRIRGTVEAVERDLLVDGFVMRYRTLPSLEDRPPNEGRFLACSFWLADAYLMCGRKAAAEKLFERLLALCNDVGLLAEQYDPLNRTMLGNFPQALSHMALINTARNLSRPGGPAEERSGHAAKRSPSREAGRRRRRRRLAQR
jgi:GH15 family glucan-1,4-alpha-glucosidase